MDKITRASSAPFNPISGGKYRVLFLYIVVRIFVSLEEPAGIVFPREAFSLHGVTVYAGWDPILPAALSVI